MTSRTSWPGWPPTPSKMKQLRFGGHFFAVTRHGIRMWRICWFADARASRARA